MAVLLSFESWAILTQTDQGTPVWMDGTHGAYSEGAYLQPSVWFLEDWIHGLIHIVLCDIVCLAMK